MRGGARDAGSRNPESENKRTLGRASVRRVWDARAEVWCRRSVKGKLVRFGRKQASGWMCGCVSMRAGLQIFAETAALTPVRWVE
jgi:hypothetical protein